MSETDKEVLTNLTIVVSKLDKRKQERLLDIAIGMGLVREEQEEAKSSLLVSQ